MTTDEGSEEFTPGLGNIPPAALEESERRPRRRWPWIVLVVVLGLVGLVAAGPSLLSTSWLNGKVRTYLNENLEKGTVVDFAQLDVSWSEGIRLTDLSLRRGEADAHPLLAVPLVEFDADVWPLLFRRLDVHKLIFHDPVVRIERTREGTLNTEDVVRTRKKKKKRKDGGEEEALVLPPIDVPLEVRNLTLVIVGDDGRTVRRGGILFDGHLTTRKGPTTFDLAVPIGDGGLDLDGTLTLFDAEGVLLPVDSIASDTTLVVRALDAGENHDLFSLFMEQAPAEGVLDGKIVAKSVGKKATASIDLTVRDIAVKKGLDAPSAAREDLRVTGEVALDGESFSVKDGLIRAEGLLATMNVSGTLASMQGDARVEADVARSAAAWQAMGIDVPQGLGGRLNGTLRLGGDRHTGHLEIRGARAPAAVEGGAPFELEQADADLAVTSADGAFRVEKATIVVPDELDIGVTGTVGHDGAIDLAARLSALVPTLVTRAKAMGLMPQDLAIAGTLGGSVALRRAADTAVTELVIEELALRDEGVLVTAAGSVRDDGSVHLTVDGNGSLERLLAAGGAGDELSGVKGTFSFAATADGPPDALTAELKSLRLDGDLTVAASGELRPDGRIAGDVTLDGRIAKAVALARGLGLVEGEVPLDGRIHGAARIGGSTERPEIPEAKLRIDDGPLDVDVSGSISELGAVEGTIEAVAQIDALLRVAHAQGHLARVHEAGGDITLKAAVAGTREKPQVPAASLTVRGPLVLQMNGMYDEAGDVHLRSDFSGGLERLASLVAAATDAEPQPVTGTYEGALSVDGPVDDLQMRLSRLIVRSEGLTVDASAALRPGGNADVAATVRGPLEGAFAIAHGFGTLPEVSGTGTVDVSLDARVLAENDQRTLTGSLSGSVLDVAMLRTDSEGVVWAEKRIVVSVPSFRMPLDGAQSAVPQRPVELKVDTDSGVRLDAKILGGTDGEPIELDAGLRGPIQPLLDASAAFAGGGGTKVAGMLNTKERLIFRGDVSAGREHAAGWTGGTVLELTDVVAPHVAISSGTLTAKIADGFLVLDPIDVAVNGGTAKGTARIGLVGEKPEHEMRLTAKDVKIDTDLAPLLARATPLLAVGDAGDAGGKTGVDFELTAKGLDTERLKRTVSGQGTMHLQGVYAESRNWIGKLLNLAGAGSRLEVLSADVPFVVKRGQVTTEKLDMAAAGMDLRIGGTVGLDGTIDYAFGLRAKEGGPKLGKLSSLADADGFLPLRLEGDLADPKLKLPKLTDALKEKVKEDGLGGLLDDLLGKDDDEEDDGTDPKKPNKKKKRKKKDKQTDD